MHRKMPKITSKTNLCKLENITQVFQPLNIENKQWDFTS